MAAQALKCSHLTFTDYMEGERDVEIRSEYVDGEIYSMADASETHNTIAQTLGSAIDNALKDTCRVWQSGMKVVGKTRDEQPFSYYPDIVAACGENMGDQYYRTNPSLLSKYYLAQPNALT